jgi:ketosteroid isomerase-like protein
MSQQNIGLVQRGYEAFGRGDIPGFLSLLDANVEWRTPGPSDLPTAGTRRGPAQVGEFFGELVQLIDFELFEPTTFLADGDRVVVLGRDRIKIKATGKPISEDWCHVFTIRDGKIVAFQEYLDMSAIAAELKTAAARA